MGIIQRLSGQGLFARALRGSVLTAGSYAVTQALRLGSNLILTRLLYPEAFGVMALVSVALVGLAMFSDMGVGPAISASPRGDERDFLDTAYTLNVMRGAVLWAATCALAWPMAQFYQAPELMQLLPAAGLTLRLGDLIGVGCTLNEPNLARVLSAVMPFDVQAGEWWGEAAQAFGVSAARFEEVVGPAERRAQAALAPGFFSLTVPTGSG